MEIIQLQRNADVPLAQDDTLPPKKRKVSEEDPSIKDTKSAESETRISSDEKRADKKKKEQSSSREGTEAESNEPELSPGQKKQVTTKKGKTQFQYDPGVPMSKDQLASWRREARRVRNRESAAASRQKIRDRIEELEGEVDQWKARFNEAMSRIQRLEGMPQQF